MKLRGPLAAALAAVLLGAAHRPAPLTVYSAPAGQRPAGTNPFHRTDGVLPNGRIAAPLGATVFIGTNPLGIAVSPDGRYAIVSNDEQQQSAFTIPPAPSIVAGYSLAVVDTKTMRVASVYHADGTTFFVGVAATHDPADPSRTIVLASDGQNNLVRIFDLGDDGSLAPEAQTIPVRGYPGSIAISPNGRNAYVVSNIGGSVTSIDLATRAVQHGASVGYFPFAAAVDGDNLFVTNGGLSHYQPLAQPVKTPRFADASADPDKSSSLSVVPLDASGDVNPDASLASIVRMDPVPDGSDVIGGARPGAIVVRSDGAYAYVALSNVDRVATVALQGGPHVVAGLDLRLFVNAPYGTEPSAEALSKDGKRLYVALAGLDAVAVLDAHNPSLLHRLGLIPTGWYPSALALSPDGRYLYVTDAKGVDGWGMLQRVDTKSLQLVKSTLSALRYSRSVAAARNNAIVPALRSKKKSNAIDHVVYISIGTGSFDAVFGGNASASTPNLQALANTYGLAENFYVDDMNLDANAQFALGGMATLHAQRTLHVNSGRAGLDAHAQDPEDYPRAGYLFNQLARAGLSYRDYGALMNVSGYQPSSVQEQGRGRNAHPIDPSGLGGLYTLDVPALAVLDGHVDLDYAGWNPQISDAARAQAFIDDMGRLVQSDQEPAFTYVWLPSAGDQGFSDADRALGRIVGFLSQTPQWSRTAVFIVSDGVVSPQDRVNLAHTYALVVSPLAKHGYRGRNHLSVASVVKTEEEILGLEPLALNDLLATDMADFFGGAPYPSAYQPIP